MLSTTDTQSNFGTLIAFNHSDIVGMINTFTGLTLVTAFNAIST